MAEAAKPLRVGALVPVRLASERLPGKALLEIEGRPVLAHLLDRVLAAREIDPELVVVCTTTDRADDSLTPVVEGCGARIFRGSRDDLVDRLGCARAAFDIDVVVQVDGDDPCADPGYMDRLVSALRDDPSADVVTIEGLPLGIATKAIRARAFAAVQMAYRTHANDTGFGYYFTRSGLCVVKTLEADAADRDDEARLTLDYEEDLQFFRALFAALWSPTRLFGVREIVECLRSQPALRAINMGRSPEYWRRTAAKVHLEFDDPATGARKRIK